MEAGIVSGSAREQGFTFVTKAVFKNMDDMAYYETECKGHLEYKAFLKSNAVVEGLISSYYTPGFSYTM